MTVLRVATFNVRRGLGRDQTTNLERTAEAIRSTGAAIVALQELDRKMQRSGLVDQPAALEELTKMTITFWPTIERGEAQYGIGLALQDDGNASFHSLPRLGREEPRGAIVARSKGLTILATHLSTERACLALQLRALARLAGEVPPPVVILGDLNATRRALGGLSRAGFEPGRRLVTHVGRRRRQIDYVLVGPGLRFRSIETIDTVASDHLPLVAELERL